MYKDSHGNGLAKGDRFKYTKKKWSAGAMVAEKDGELGVNVMRKDLCDKFVPLEKFLRKCVVAKIKEQ